MILVLGVLLLIKKRFDCDQIFFIISHNQMLNDRNLMGSEDQLQTHKNLSVAPLKGQVCVSNSIQSKIEPFYKNQYIIDIKKINIEETAKEISEQLEWILQRCKYTEAQLEKTHMQKEQKKQGINQKITETGNSAQIAFNQKIYKLLTKKPPEKILEAELRKKMQIYQEVFNSWSNLKVSKNQQEQKQRIEQLKEGLEIQKKHFKEILTQKFEEYFQKEQIHKQSRNPITSFLNSLSGLFLEGLSVSYYLPSLLTIKFIGIDSIDELNQKAFISLKLELKVKVPKNAKYKSIVDRSLSKLKIKVKSNLICTESVTTFLQAGQNWNEERFTGFAIINEEDEPSIWTQFRNYNFGKERSRNSKRRLQNFEGVVYRADLNNVQVQIKPYLTLSPCEMLDLTGYVEIPEIINNLSLIEEESYENPIDPYHQFILEDIGINAANISIVPNLLNVKKQHKFGSMIQLFPRIMIGDFDLAQKLVEIQVTNERQSKQMKLGLRGWHWGDKITKQAQNSGQNQQKSICHFHFPIYRLPSKGLGIIYVPTIVLGIINLLVFFQDSSRDGLGDRIANNATLLISFVGMITVLQDTFKKPSFTITSLIIYLVVLTPMFCMIETMSLYSTQRENKPFESALFWISAAIVGMSIVYPLLLIIFHFCSWQDIYNHDEGIKASEDIILPGDSEIQEEQFKPLSQNAKNIKIFESQNRISNEATIEDWNDKAFTFWVLLKGEIYSLQDFSNKFLWQIYDKLKKFEDVLKKPLIRDVLISKNPNKQKEKQKQKEISDKIKVIQVEEDSEEARLNKKKDQRGEN